MATGAASRGRSQLWGARAGNPIENSQRWVWYKIYCRKLGLLAKKVLRKAGQEGGGVCFLTRKQRKGGSIRAMPTSRAAWGLQVHQFFTSRT